METVQLVQAETRLINRLLIAHNIQAKTHPDWTQIIRSGFIRYGLKVAHGERMAKIDAIMRDISNRLTEQRGRRFGLPERVPARLSDYPVAIEVPHPQPQPLVAFYGPMRSTPSHTMTVGRSYTTEPHTERIAFDSAPHILVAGTTNAGKTVLQQMMLLSLCWGTSPGELQIVLVDLKNEDMLTYTALPHVVRFAGTVSEAIAAIRAVRDEKDRRIADPNRKPHRIVLWIDELLQLAQEREAREALADLASIGRSKLINLVAATQHPTSDGGMGALMRANFGCRLVGVVAPGQAHIATGRAQTGADMLPPKLGAFLRVQGTEIKRFQSFLVDPEAARTVIKQIGEKWALAMKGLQGRQEVTMASYEPDTSPAIAGYSQLKHISTGGEDGTFAVSDYFPVRHGRPLTETETQAVRQMAEAGKFDYRGKFSMNRAMTIVYGSRSPERSAWIREALESTGAEP